MRSVGGVAISEVKNKNMKYKYVLGAAVGAVVGIGLHFVASALGSG